MHHLIVESAFATEATIGTCFFTNQTRKGKKQRKEKPKVDYGKNHFSTFSMASSQPVNLDKLVVRTMVQASNDSNASQLTV